MATIPVHLGDSRNQTMLDGVQGSSSPQKASSIDRALWSGKDREDSISGDPGQLTAIQSSGRVLRSKHLVAGMLLIKCFGALTRWQALERCTWSITLFDVNLFKYWSRSTPFSHRHPDEWCGQGRKVSSRTARPSRLDGGREKII